MPANNTVRCTVDIRHMLEQRPNSSSSPFKWTILRDLGIFSQIHIGRASYPDPPLIILKFLCCVVIELFSLKDPKRLMQKTYLFPVQIGMPHANASKIFRIYGCSTLPDYW
jgi:hypothetical protein